MGKKLQGAKLRAKKRATAALSELQEQQADVAGSRTISEAPDAALFVLDTTGEAHVPHHLRPDKPKDKFQRHQGLSAKEQTLVERLRSRHKPEELQRMADQGRKILDQQQRGRRRPGPDTTATNFDLWDSSNNSDNNNPKKNKATKDLAPAPPRKKVAKTPKVTVSSVAVVQVDVAKPGQSYHPDPVAHAQILEKAMAIEMARERKKRERAAPLSQGMSAETRALLLPDSSDEEEDDDDNLKDDDDEETSVPLLKRVSKLTKAQRNKKKRRRVEEAMEKQAKKQKILIKQLNQVHQFKKELNKQDEAKRQLAVQEQKDKEALQQQSIPGKNVEFKATDPEHAPLVAVVLPADTTTTTTTTTTTSLRTLRPRGNLARDRVASWADRQVAVVPRAGVRGGGATPSRQQRRRPKSVKGRHNAGTKGKGFELLG